MALRFVGPDDFLIAHLTRFNIGADDIASAVLLVGLEDGRIGSDLGLHLPCHGLDLAAGSWSPFTRIAFVFDEIGGGDLMIAP